MKYDSFVLKNGLRLVLAPMPDSQTATVLIMTGTGSRYESEQENGLAHFLEHMFFKGTKRRASAKTISEELDTLGAVYNAYTAKERTAYFAKVSSKYIANALDVISDIFLNSTLPQKEITKERGAIIQEIDMYEDMPMRIVDNVFDALLYGESHPLGRTILGPKENIRAFKRKDFIEYLRRNYTPLNTVVCIAGAFDAQAVLRRVRKDFGKIPQGNPPDYIRFASEQSAPRVAIRHKNTDQTHLMIGVPAYPYQHRDEAALAVLSTILGGGMSSRLFSEVREKRGLAYSIHAWVERYPDTGAFVVQAGVEHGKLETTLSTILREFKKIARTPVSKKELLKAQSYLKGTLAISLETSDEVANHAATSIINTGRIRKLEDIVREIEAVRPSDIQRVARDILRKNKLNLAIIGPHTNSERLEQLLIA